MTESFKTIISSTLNRINEARNRTYYFAENVPFIDAQITTSIPDMGIAGAILASTIDSEEELQSLQKKFLKLKSTCHKLENQIIKYQTDIQKIQNITNRIRTRLRNFEDLLNGLAEFVPIIRTLIKIARGVLAIQASVPVAGGFVSGTVIIKQKDIIDAALAKLEEVIALQQVFNSIAGTLIPIAEEIDETLLPLQNRLSEINAILVARCRDIDLLFLQVLAQANINDDSSVDTTATGELTITVSSTLNIEKIIDNLEISSKSKFIEYLSENGHTGYQITKG